MENKKFCSGCGTALSPTAQFCHKCGRLTARVCAHCGKPLRSDAVFCSACGTAVAYTPKAPAARPQGQSAAVGKPPKKQSRAPFVLGWVFKPLFLLISIACLVFAFLPWHRVSRNITVTGIESIVFATDTFYSQSEEELRESDLFEKLQVLLTDTSDYKNWSENIFHYTARLTLRSENTPFRSSYLLPPIFFLMLLLVTAAFFVFSLCDFIFLLLGKERPRWGRISLKLLAAIPLLSLLFYFALRFCYSDLSLLGLSSFETYHGYVTVTAVLNFAIPLACLAGIAICRLCCATKTFDFSFKATLYRSLSFAASLLLLFSVFIPVFRLNVTTTFTHWDTPKESSVSFESKWFDNLMLPEDTEKMYTDLGDMYHESTLRHSFQSFSSFTETGFRDAKKPTSPFIVTSFAAFGAETASPLFAQLPLFSLLLASLACVLLWHNILALVLNKKSSLWGVLIPKIAAVMLALLILGLLIGFVAITNFNLDTINFGEGKGASLSLASGGILMAVFAILTFLVPMRKKKEN